MSCVTYVHVPGAAGPTARALARNVGEGALHLAFRGGNALPLVRTTGAFANLKRFPQKTVSCQHHTITTSAYGICLRVSALQGLL